MANFNDIKQEIDQNVNTNGQQAITGAILNETLKDMIDEVDEKKQDTLVSGSNIKTINGDSLLGSGDIQISGGGGLWTSGTGEDSLFAPGTGSDIDVDPSDPSIIYNQSESSGYRSIATGSFTHATGTCATTFGNGSYATGANSVALGSYNSANGENSVALGSYNSANGENSVALGSYTAVYSTGSNSVALGNSTIATADNSIAAGCNAHAFGPNSVASGNDTFASGENSIASGYHTIANGSNSVALGSGTIANGDFSVALGTYNNMDESDYLFTIGDGSFTQIAHEYGTPSWYPNPDNPESTDTWYEYTEERKNAVDVKANGDVYIEDIGGYDGTNSYSAARVQDVINSKQNQLVSGVNIKTVNGNDLLGSGNIVISGGGGSSYTAGNGIDIDQNNVISVDASDLAGNGLRVDANGSLAAIPYTAGGGISIIDYGSNKEISARVRGAGYGLLEDGTGYIGINDSVVQEKLTAGSNIQIIGDTIYATDTTYSAGSGLNLNGTTFSADTSVLQEKLTSGTNIKTINGNSLLGSGDIQISGGGSSYTAGNGIDIDQNNVISVDASDLAGNGLRVDGNGALEVVGGTPGSYSAGNGIDITNGVISVDENYLDGEYLPLEGGVLQSTVNPTRLVVKSPNGDHKIDAHAGNSGLIGIEYNKTLTNPSDGDVKQLQIWDSRIDLFRWDSSRNNYRADTLYFPSKKTGTLALDTDLQGKQDTLVSGSNIKTINGNSILGSGDLVISGGGTSYTAGNGIDITGNTISADTSVLQEKLTSGSNIKTINGNSLLGSGNIVISGGSGGLWTSGTGTNSLLSPEASSSSAIASGEGALNAGHYTTNGSGYRSRAFGKYSASFGTNNDVQGENAAGFGENNYVSGKNSFVIGDANRVAGASSFSGGQNSRSSSTACFSFNGEATANKAIAINGAAYGIAATGIGVTSNAQANNSTAIGYFATTTGNADYSVSLGYGTQTYNNGETALGNYNTGYSSGTYFLPSEQSFFTIGNGTGDSSRSNVLEIKKNNDLYLDGVGGFTGNNSNSSGIKPLQTVLNGKQDTLVSGSNIKTINGNSILGSGDIQISGGQTISGGTGIDVTNGVVSVDDTYLDGKYLSLEGGLLQAGPLSTETLLDIAAPDDSSAVSISADTVDSKLDLSANVQNVSILDGDTYSTVFSNTGEIQVSAKTVNPSDPTDITGTTYTLVLPQKNDTIATLSDIPSGGSSYSAGTGISIDANNVISNTAPDPGLWEAGTGTNSIQSLGAFLSTSTNTIAVGYHAQARRPQSIAIGYEAATGNGSKGDYSVALGTSLAGGNYSYAMGNGIQALGDNSVALGSYNIAYPNSESSDNQIRFAIGNGIFGSRSDAFEIKQNDDAYLVGVGGFDGTNASQSQSIQTVINSKQNQLVSGTNIKTINGNSILGSGDLVISGGGGSSLWTSGTGTDSLVAPATVSSSLSQDPAAGEGAISCGYDTNADGDYSFAQGGQSSASGDYSFAANNGTASGDYSTAFGTSAARGDYSFAAGYGSVAEAERSIALAGGHTYYDDSDPNNIIDAQRSVAIGDGARAHGRGSVAIGVYSHASGAASVALGMNEAAGDYSFAAGNGSVADGDSSVALGGQSIGDYSLTGGAETIGYGFSSVALGLGVETYDQADGTDEQDPNAGEVALGRYNYSEANVIFSVGCGYDNGSSTINQNAITITNDGKIFLKGLGGYTGTSVSGCVDLVSFLNNL